MFIINQLSLVQLLEKPLKIRLVQNRNIEEIILYIMMQLEVSGMLAKMKLPADKLGMERVSAILSLRPKTKLQVLIKSYIRQK